MMNMKELKDPRRLGSVEKSSETPNSQLVLYTALAVLGAIALTAN
jgi:hypothetical protein